MEKALSSKQVSESFGHISVNASGVNALRPMVVQALTLRVGTLVDAPSLSQLYCTSFPAHARSMLGTLVCQRFFEAALSSKAYQVLLAESESTPVGFSMIHIDRTVSLSRDWVNTAIPQVIRHCALNPRLAISLISHQLKKRLKRRVTAGNTLPLPDSISDSAYIDFLCVSPSFRGQGFAQKLLESSIQTAREHGRQLVKLTVENSNRQAIRLYSKTGFRLVSSSEDSSTSIYEFKIS